MTMKAAPAGTASFIEMLIKEALAPGGALSSIEPDSCRIELIIRRDPAVPGGWAVSASGAPMGPTEKRESANLMSRISDWLLSGDTGVSSEAILWALSGKRGKYFAAFARENDCWPRDPADLGRCVRLLDRLPEWRQRIAEVADKFPGWAPMVARWADLEALYAEELKSPDGMAPKTYALMQELHGLCMAAAGWIETSPGSWKLKV